MLELNRPIYWRKSGGPKEAYLIKIGFGGRNFRIEFRERKEEPFKGSFTKRNWLGVGRNYFYWWIKGLPPRGLGPLLGLLDWLTKGNQGIFWNPRIF